MNDVIRFDAVTLQRRMQEEFSYDLKRTLFSIVERRFKPPTRRVVIRDFSLSVGAGEKLGIIGPNGSGKSTLLKLISGILHPSEGTVRTRGTIAPLIELGAGFDPELSVEDNIVYYGVLLGYSRARMRGSIQRVLEFAELLEYRRIPVKALSSGMAARLGFAVATDVRPDILLLDEIFAVGDEAFRRKSATRLRELWRGDHTIVVVSHDLAAIAAQCERALWLENGMVRDIGEAASVVAAYANDVSRRTSSAVGERLSDTQAIGNVDILQVDHDVGTLLIRGWAVAPDGERTGTSVGLFVDERFLAEAAYGDARPDVVEVLRRDAALRSGFHGSFSLHDLAPGSHRVVPALFDHVSEAYHPIGEPSEIDVHAAARTRRDESASVRLTT